MHRIDPLLVAGNAYILTRLERLMVAKCRTRRGRAEDMRAPQVNPPLTSTKCLLASSSIAVSCSSRQSNSETDKTLFNSLHWNQNNL
jgi:hypothetical protein